MIVLGIGGGLDLIDDNKYNVAHDSTAVLLDDGKVIFAVEEERLNRIKHTDKAPLSAMRACLDYYHIDLSQVDRIAVYGQEQALSAALRRTCLDRAQLDFQQSIRSFFQELLVNEFGETFDFEQMVFVPHHLAHAVSTYNMSGFADSLVFTMDGVGDGISTQVLSGRDGQLETLHTWYMADSLGFFYVEVIKFLGYEMFDEYKVMGLAPYGNPARYRRMFKKFYSLLEGGSYTIHTERIDYLFEIMQPRKKHEPFSQVHKDIAASLQEALETIVFHVLQHYRNLTGQDRLCLAGGVALNCTLNGKILYANLFKEMFVQPIAHDAGAALGAALYVSQKEAPQLARPVLEHLYLGSDIGSNEEIEQHLQEWKDFLVFEKSAAIDEKAASLLADGNVIGWAQGRAEFGPRALGNRSILADPRPVENREIINEMVKMREAYRPFAPAVLEECAGEYYELPTDTRAYPYMIYVVKVQEEQRLRLGAVTHTDGTARIQTVSRTTNPKFWQLIREFQKQTGVPILLNTSFNNNAEPIVNTVDDAIVCFLTTKLHYLVVGDYLIGRREDSQTRSVTLIPSLQKYALLEQTIKQRQGTQVTEYTVGCNYSLKYQTSISRYTYQILSLADGERSCTELLALATVPEEVTQDVLREVLDLWVRRLIVMKPSHRRVVA